jgi:hypothetical protein
MPDTAAPTALQRVTELRVSGHLMMLESGLFCIVNQGGPPARPGGDGLPGVRISLPPGGDPHNPRVAITGFREDGWLSSAGDAALVRVWNGPAPVLVTIYQGHDPAVPAPNLQVMRLLEGGGAMAAAPAAPMRPEPALPPAPAALPPPARPAAPSSGPREIAAHIQRRGDVLAAIGEWMGDRKSQRWIEGFAIAPQNGIALEDLEYQAVLGRGWLSPWVEGGQFCGSRGMALPILGLRVRLRGAAAEAFDVSLTASFVDGSEVGPVGNGDPCEADTLAPLEAFLLELPPRRTAGRAAPAAPMAAARPAAASRPQPAKTQPAKTQPAKTRTEPAPSPRGKPRTTSKSGSRTPPAPRRR